MTLTVGSLCSGYEATGLGLALAGWDHRLAFVADPDPAAAKVLAHRHPDVTNLGDIGQVDWAEVEPVDLLTMGFPCTDISCAGKRAGLAEDVVIPAGVMPCGCQWADHKILDCVAQDQWGGSPAWNCEQGLIDQAAASVDWLNEQDLEGDGPPPERVVKGTRSGVWAYGRQCIAELRPPLVLIENVAALLSTPANRSTDGTDGGMEPGPADLGDGPGGSLLRAAGAVLGDLADLGYDAVWQVVSAASVGAPHLRKRVFILAWPATDHAHITRLGGGRPSGTCAGGALGGRRGGAADVSTLAGTGAGLGTQNGLSLLPTPRTSDTQGTGEHGTGGLDLRTAVSLLPTPRARDVKGAETEAARAGRIERGTAHAGHDLPTALSLLPTPTVADSRGSRNATAGRTNPKPTTTTTSWTLGDVAYADRWGEYAPAIARWEAVFGRPAPDPTEPGSKGQPRLSPAFVEWMQGLPDGYVTAVPGITRNDALRLLGNANPPQQYAAAITQLAALVAHVTATEASAA